MAVDFSSATANVKFDVAYDTSATGDSVDDLSENQLSTTATGPVDWRQDDPQFDFSVR